MQFDYDKVAHRYDSYRSGGGPYLERLLHLATETGARRVLELGPGTGNNTAPFQHAYPCELIALDRSFAMIAKAREKGVTACWVQGSATDMPVATAGVDFVFAVYVLHHIPDLDAVCRESARVLHQGSAAFVTASTQFIERHPINRYMPSFAAIDKARFQPIPVIRHALERAGFDAVDEERFVAEPRQIDKAYVDRVANKFVSTYDLIPPDEFEAGLKRLYADIEKKGRLDEPMEWESVVIWGTKTA